MGRIGPGGGFFAPRPAFPCLFPLLPDVLPDVLPPAPATPARLAGLDHLRALAIGLVLLFHYRIFPHPAWLTDNPVGRFGWTGVDLFFVLSGYLITAQLVAEVAARGRVRIGAFFRKRAFRILPAYGVLVAIYFLFPGFHEREGLAPLWKYLTFTQNLGLDLSVHGTFSHAWSLCVEEHFYLVLPLLLAALTALKAGWRGALLVPLLLALGLLVRWWCWHALVPPDDGLAWYQWIYYPTYARLDGLLVGVAIAVVFQFRPRLRDRLTAVGNGWLLLSAGLLTAAYAVCNEPQTLGASVFGFPLVALAYGALVLGALSPTSVLYRTPSRLTGGLAALSYALYLSHKGLIHLTQLYGGQWGLSVESNTMMVACLTVAVVGAWGLNRLIEKPFLRLRDRGQLR